MRASAVEPQPLGGMGRTTDLRREIKARFFPLAVSRAFTPSDAGAPFSLEFRRVVNGEEQYIDIQWEKYGAPRFVLNFMSSKGSGRLQPGSGSSTSSWFRQDPSLLSKFVFRVPIRPSSQVVDELIALFPEVEDFFERGRVGDHLRIWSNAG